MRRETAESFIDVVKRLDQIFEEIGTLSQSIEDNDEKRKGRRAIATTVCNVYENITKDIVQVFPDLDPDNRPR